MSVAEMYSAVFAPDLFVLVATLLLVGYEVRAEDRPRGALTARFGAVIGAWVLAFAVYQGGQGLVSGTVPGGEDFYASIGLIVGFAVIWAAWKRQRWGPFVPAYALLLVATSVVHAVVVPMWDVSSHVLYAAVPTAYLATVNRQFAVLLVGPVGMVWSRVTLNAHTVAESVAGVGLASVIVAGVLLATDGTRSGPVL